MKKLYILLFAALLSGSAFSQITLLSLDFNNYVGDSATAIPDYYISWNSPSGGTPSASYYSSNGNYGLSPNSYKFGIDSATIITPYFGGADSLTFWHKGNGTSGGNSKFYIYSSNDSITFTLLDSITSFPSTGVTYGHGLDSTSMHYLKFFYHKSGGNMAFDDLHVFNNLGLGIKKQATAKAYEVYPNPSANGIFTFDLGTANAAEVKVFNIIGKQVYAKTLANGSNGKHAIDLSSLPSGSYFASVKSGNDKKMIRLVIN